MTMAGAVGPVLGALAACVRSCERGQAPAGQPRVPGRQGPWMRWMMPPPGAAQAAARSMPGGRWD
jgi:hypothetical protein